MLKVLLILLQCLLISGSIFAAETCSDVGLPLELGYYEDMNGVCTAITVHSYEGTRLRISSGGISDEVTCVNSTCVHPRACGTKLVITGPTSFAGIYKHVSRCSFVKR